VNNGEILCGVTEKRNFLHVMQRKKTDIDIISLETDP